jgi:hypothetical protein
MAKLHELLAAEKTVTGARDHLYADTQMKFKKADQYFTGMIKTLEMIEDSPEAKAAEAAARQEKELPTTVPATMDYFLDFWAKAENLLHKKNVSNTKATTTLMFRGATLAPNVPIDEVMGLEARLGKLRELILEMPTLDASRGWKHDDKAPQAGTWKATSEQVTTKTEKVETPLIMAPATDKHPAQVKMASSDKVVGKFTLLTSSGATTAIQKANMIAVVDDLLVEVKMARTRANSVDVVDTDDLGSILKNILMAALTAQPVNNQV